MKMPEVESPDVTDAAAKEATGRTLKQWFGELDALGGVARGRRALTNHVYEATKKDAWWSTTLVVEYERARGQRDKDGAPTGYAICATKTIAAPLRAVFGAFGDARALDRWLGPKTTLAFADGGALANGDGNRATLTRVRKDRDLRLVWESAPAPGSAVDVLFADKGRGKTGITLNHARIQSRRAADQARAAWGAALEGLKALLEG
jgi:uncharacterized protein YndB with AHSA1/START domain